MYAINSPKSRDNYICGIFVSEKESTHIIPSIQKGAPLNPPAFEQRKINCPHCAKEIIGRDRLLFEKCMETDDFVQWIIPCPNCGRAINKNDMNMAMERN
jgi:endogenous inhibitor of DNA gyrase (YacG/DUF329 family)